MQHSEQSFVTVSMFFLPFKMFLNFQVHQNFLKLLKDIFQDPGPGYSSLEVMRWSPGICMNKCGLLPLLWEILSGALISAFEDYFLGNHPDQVRGMQCS